MTKFTADTFRSVFESGHAPGSRTPGMPLTADGTLLDLICRRPEGERLIRYRHPDGSDWRFEIQPPPQGLVLGVIVTITRPQVKRAVREVRIAVYAPTVDTDKQGGLRPTNATIQASALVLPREARALPDLIEVAAVLAESLMDEADAALAPEIEVRRAEWEERANARKGA